jgi:hypothetical protein
LWAAICAGVNVGVVVVVVEFPSMVPRSEWKMLLSEKDKTTRLSSVSRLGRQARVRFIAEVLPHFVGPSLANHPDYLVGKETAFASGILGRYEP